MIKIDERVKSNIDEGGDYEEGKRTGNLGGN